MTTELIQIAPSLIAPSLTNPRKTFNQERLAELAESIKTSGVHSPLLLRPLPADRLQDTFTNRAAGADLPTYELVTGERRLRASIMAEQAMVPALVRNLTDDEVLEIQIIENLQRDDLSELEEAEGYEMLMQHGHNGERLTVDQVAAKIGKSRSYVYARLKLLDLIPDSRKAMREGKLDASKGLLLARIPDPKLQLKALKEITHEGFNGRTMGYREAADHVQRTYMLRLSDARFSIKDADLVPAAGACRACPKRTGANPDLFNDVKSADVCTDPPCFTSKQDAHAAQQRAEAVARGQTIIDGREAKELMPNSWSNRVEGYLRLDDAQDSPTDKPLRSLLAKQMASQDVHPVLVANPHKNGELVAVLKADQVAELLKAKGDTKAADEIANAVDQGEKQRKAQEKKEAENALEAAWRWAVLEATWIKVQAESQGNSSGPKLDEVTRHMALRQASSMNQDNAKKLTKLLGLGKVAPKEALLDWIRTTGNPGAAMLLLVMFNEVEYIHWRPDGENNIGLFLVAKAFGVDPAAIEAQTRANTRAAKASEKKSAKASSTEPPAAQATDKREAKAKKSKPAGAAPRKAKTTPEEALQGIAAAMQGKEESAASTAENPGAADAAQGNEGTADDGGADQGDSDDAPSTRHPHHAWPFPKGGKKAVVA
jgi:ParB/RepB/Spo0J family partition protein